MSSQKNSRDTPDATSLPESGDGTTHCNSQDGQQASLFGPRHCPANRSQPPAPSNAKRMIATYGPSSSTLSRSADLQSSLENRLLVAMDGDGCPEFKMTWKRQSIPRRRSILARLASVRRTPGHDSGGSGNDKQLQLARLMDGSAKTVDSQSMGDADATTESDSVIAVGSGLTRSLLIMPMDASTVALRGWMTPAANDDASGLPGAKMQPMLPAQVKMCGADTIEDARMATRGVSHPAFHCWLMGFPIEWNSCGATAMQSCRK